MPKRTPTNSLRRTALVAGILTCTAGSATSQTCIVPIDGLGPRPFRELSGLTWDPVLQLALGVRDERRDYPGYEIFAFDPDAVNAQGCHTALPLLSDSLSDAFQLDDLEAVTRTGEGVYYAVTSLSLDRIPSPTRDRWSRFQGVRFTVTIRDGRPVIESIQRVSANSRPDLREWVISSSGRDWSPEAYRGRAESGGINVEALSWSSDGSLLLGFRGPLDPGPSAPVLRLRVTSPDAAPEPLGWTYIDMSTLPASNKEQGRRGIRAMARIPDRSDETYVVAVGHTGPRHDPLRLVLWNPVTGAVLDRGSLPDGFVAEGAAVLEEVSGNLTVLLVDDLQGRALRRSVPSWE
jgi:hypothetical protein